MSQKPHKVPLHWDSKGRILKWVKSGTPVKNLEGKEAFSWSESEGRVYLWVYSRPAKNWERIPDEMLTPKQREFYSFGSAEVEEKIRTFSFGKLAAQDDNHLLISFVDDLRASEADLRNKCDPWGGPPQSHTKRDRAAMRSFVKHKKWMLRFIGRVFYKWIEDRDAQAIDAFAKSVQAAKGLSLTSHADNGIWHSAESFQGTVYRCWRVLWSWSLHEGSLPTKRGLREYVIQEWEAMGNSSSTVSEFSDALKALGLSKLPNGPRQKSVVKVKKKKKVEI